MIVKPKDIIFFVWLTLLAIIAVGYAIVTIPSPEKIRAMRIDEQRTNDLSALQTSIQEYYNQNKTLPQQLNELNAADRYYIPNTLNDPETEQLYEYQPIDEMTYTLCATFATATKDLTTPRYGNDYSVYTPPQFNHPQGYFCFELKVEDYSYNDPKNTFGEPSYAEDLPATVINLPDSTYEPSQPQK